MPSFDDCLRAFHRHHCQQAVSLSPTNQWVSLYLFYPTTHHSNSLNLPVDFIPIPIEITKPTTPLVVIAATAIRPFVSFGKVVVVHIPLACLNCLHSLRPTKLDSLPKLVKPLVIVACDLIDSGIAFAPC